MTDARKAYCIPNESGLASEARAVGRQIGKLLDTLGSVDWHIAHGGIVEDCHDLGVKIRESLIADGWRITVNAHDKWTVLPPKS
jgi:hypothetical protein